VIRVEDRDELRVDVGGRSTFTVAATVGSSTSTDSWYVGMSTATFAGYSSDPPHREVERRGGAPGRVRVVASTATR
jgi:hypothetical protein